MSYVSQVFGGSRSTKTIKTVHSVAGFATFNISTSVGDGAIAVNSGALTANALATVFSATGTAVTMTHLSVRCSDATARTLRVVVEIDGNAASPAFDYTSASISNTNNGVLLAGWRAPWSTSFALPPINSQSSLIVKVASNLTETDKFIIEYAYQELI